MSKLKGIRETSINSRIRCGFGKRPSKLLGRSRRSAITLGIAILGLGFASSLNFTNPTAGRVAAFSESINTFASADCSTPKDEWNLGQIACAVATEATDRRIAWVAPDGTIGQVSGFLSGTGSDLYTIPTGTHPLAQVGTWTVTTIDASGFVTASASFVVHNPAAASADISLSKFGPFEGKPGTNLNYRVEVTNKGPDSAQSVTLIDSVPAGTTFVSEVQNSGPAFTCVTPSVGAGSGTISCTIANLPPNETAVFSFAFQLNAGTSNGTIISNTASVSSATTELRVADNSATASTTVASGTTECTISCLAPAPVSTNQCTTAVTYAAPTITGNCGSNPEGGSGVVCSPPSGSTFATGSTTVNCTAPSGDSCSFGVVVNYTGQTGGTGISCPGDVEVTGDVSAGTALVNYSAPTTTGDCVKVACSPPSGSVFATGVTTVNCVATDPANGTATCSFTVTVVGGGGCLVNCPNDILEIAGAGVCNAAVSYSPPTTVGSCSTVTCSPPSGSTFPTGTTVVTCVSTTGAACDFTVTVVPSTAPTITTCAANKTVNVTANCEAAIPNLVGEVVATGCNVTISQSPAAGTLVAAGTYTVTITAENLAGDATCTTTVTVHSLSENFAGFFSPVSNPPALNLVNAGRAIPVKFSLNGNKGLAIFADGYPASGEVPCDSGATPVEVGETVTAGSSSLSYDASSDKYTYVWATQSSWAGTCRQLIIKFNDGCIFRADFKFR